MLGDASFHRERIARLVMDGVATESSQEQERIVAAIK
jgi:hypothetical protein